MPVEVSVQLFKITIAAPHEGQANVGIITRTIPHYEEIISRCLLYYLQKY